MARSQEFLDDVRRALIADLARHCSRCAGGVATLRDSLTAPAEATFGDTFV
jgi:hypothetical protein